MKSSTTVKTEEALLMKNGTVEASEPMPAMLAIRIVRRLSGARVSSSSGIDRSRISTLELGHDQLRPHEREKLARALNVAPDLVDRPVSLFVKLPRSKGTV